MRTALVVAGADDAVDLDRDVRLAALVAAPALAGLLRFLVLAATDGTRRERGTAPEVRVEENLCRQR
jgi:hypothetical protein